MPDTTTYLSGGRIQGRSDDSVPIALTNTSWKVVARATITGGDNSTIDTGTGNGTTSNCVVTENTMYATPKENLVVFINSLHRNGSVTSYVLFNNDTSGTDNSSGQYAFRTSENGETDIATGDYRTNQNDGIRFDRGGSSFTRFTIKNILNKEKICIGNCTTDTQRWESVGKWVGTAQINRISVRNEDGGDYSTGDEILVLGCDNNEADGGTNFWQELTKKELPSSSSTFNTDAFTAKKYLMVQIYGNQSSGNSDLSVRFNSNTSNYNRRYSTNGGNDGTNTGITSVNNVMGAEGNRDPFFSNSYIFNKSDKAKLILTDLVFAESGSGAGNTVSRRETTNAWTDTSAQITSIQVIGGTFDAGSIIRVWGSD